ncbi:MAG: SIS domain-containing protein [Chloroflexota bacterium]|nr:SIS domain-containing protein [Chloroflexota bacterium]
MRSEIGEQPAVLAATLQRLAAPAAAVATAMRRRAIPFAVVAGRGSSSHAGQYGRYLLEIGNGVPVVEAAPSVMTAYGARPGWGEAALIGISQSGRVPEVVRLVAIARGVGALTVGLTNDPDSPLASAAEFTLVTQAGQETSVPATKTYTSALLTLAMLSARLGPDAGRSPAGAAGDASTPVHPLEGLAADDLAGVPQAALRVLGQERRLASVGRSMRDTTRCLVVGSGFNRSSAFEMALKLQETGYVLAQAHDAADLLHGPLAVLERGFRVIGLVRGGPTCPGVIEALRRAHERGARTLVISDGDVDEAALDGLCDERMDLDSGLSEPLSPIGFAIAGQLLALHVALSKGLVPEVPRALQKVTVTG